MSKKKKILTPQKSVEKNTEATKNTDSKRIRKPEQESILDFSKLTESKLFFIAFFIFSVFTLLFFQNQLLGKTFFWSSYWTDYIEQHLPFVKINIEAFKNGEIPAWNPFVYGGAVHLADPATQFYYPLHFILYILAPTGDALIKDMEYLIMLHFLIAQISMYMLAKQFNISFWGRVVASVAFAFSCSVVCRWQMPPVLYAICFAPLALSFFISFIQTQKISSIVGATIVLAFIFLAGQPQFYFYAMILIMTISLFLLIQRNRNKELSNKQTVYTTLLLFVPVLLSVGLSAIQILHTLEFLPYSQRGEINYDFATDGSVAWQQLKTIFTPRLFGYFKGGYELNYASYYLTPNKPYHYWETAFYFGAIPFALSIAGFYYKRKDILTVGVVLLLIFAVLHALGSNSFFFKMLFNFPGFDKFRMPGRILYLGTILICVMAGYGWDYLFDNDKNTFKIIFVVAVVFILFISAQFSIQDVISKFQLDETNATILQSYKLKYVLYIFIMLVLFLLHHFNLVRLDVLGFVLCCVIFYDLYFYNASYKECDVNTSQSLSLDEKYYKPLQAPKNTIYRYTPNDLRFRLYRRNQSVLYNVHNTDGFYALTFDKKLLPNIPYYDLMSVKFKSIPLRNNNEGGIDYGFEENTRALKHERMVYKKALYDSTTMKLDSFDFSNIALVTEPLNLELPDKNAEEVSNKVDMITDSYSKQIYDVKTDEPGILVLAELYYPSWKVKVDNVVKEVLKINSFQRGVYMEKGNHKVEFYYDSEGYKKGKLITYISLFICLVVAVLSFIQSKKYNN